MTSERFILSLRFVCMFTNSRYFFHYAMKQQIFSFSVFSVQCSWQENHSRYQKIYIESQKSQKSCHSSAVANSEQFISFMTQIPKFVSMRMLINLIESNHFNVHPPLKNLLQIFVSKLGKLNDTLYKSVDYKKSTKYEDVLIIVLKTTRAIKISLRYKY